MLEALSYLKCPMCGGPLEVGSCEQKHANKLWNGTVVCQRCKGSRVVREGVLDLEGQATGQEASTINAFGKEWTHYWKHGDATRIQVPYSTRDIPMSESCARRNFGYGGGNNSGLKCAIDEGAAYILLLNNESWHLIACVGWWRLPRLIVELVRRRLESSTTTVPPKFTGWRHRRLGEGRGCA
jgi:uncharacterized protein YbaR (Trm112 family)